MDNDYAVPQVVAMEGKTDGEISDGAPIPNPAGTAPGREEPEMMEELPGMLALAKGVSEQRWPHTMDAQVWEKEFNGALAAKGIQPIDPGWIISWFANAIMAGYDTAQHRAAAELERVKGERDEANRLVVFWSKSSEEWKASRERHRIRADEEVAKRRESEQRATTAEADAKHVRQANENYRRENELAVATLEKAREAALQDAADFLSDALNRLYHSAGEKVVYMRDVAAAGHEFVKGIRALKDAAIARSRDE